MHGGGGRVPGVDWIAGLAVAGQPLRRGREVVRGARVGGGDVLPEQPRRTAWPEHQADPEADSEADRDVLDTDEPDLPADRLDDVEQDQDDDCERGLPGREGRDALVRMSPTFQPTGWMMLNRNRMTTVNAACPAANGAPRGAEAAIS